MKSNEGWSRLRPHLSQKGRKLILVAPLHFDGWGGGPHLHWRNWRNWGYFKVIYFPLDLFVVLVSLITEVIGVVGRTLAIEISQAFWSILLVVCLIFDGYCSLLGAPSKNDPWTGCWDFSESVGLNPTTTLGTASSMMAEGFSPVLLGCALRLSIFRAAFCHIVILWQENRTCFLIGMFQGFFSSTDVPVFKCCSFWGPPWWSLDASGVSHGLAMQFISCRNQRSFMELPFRDRLPFPYLVQ